MGRGMGEERVGGGRVKEGGNIMGKERRGGRVAERGRGKGRRGKGG